MPFACISDNGDFMMSKGFYESMHSFTWISDIVVFMTSKGFYAFIHVDIWHCCFHYVERLLCVYSRGYLRLLFVWCWGFARPWFGVSGFVVQKSAVSEVSQVTVGSPAFKLERWSQILELFTVWRNVGAVDSYWSWRNLFKLFEHLNSMVAFSNSLNILITFEDGPRPISVGVMMLMNGSLHLFKLYYITLLLLLLLLLYYATLQYSILLLQLNCVILHYIIW